MRPHPGALSKYHSKPGFEVNRSRFLLFEMKELYSFFCFIKHYHSFFFFDFDIIFKVRICIFLGCLTEN